MNRRTILTSRCLHLAICFTFVSARIIPNYETTNDQQGLEQIPQTDNKFKWQFANLNSGQTSDLEKLVKQSLENIFKNEEHFGGFGLKTTLGKQTETTDLTDDKSVDHDVDLSSPYILKVPVPQPYPVHIPVKQPFTVPIYKLVPEEVERKVPIPVEKLVPVYKEKPVKVIVEKHHPYHVYKPYPVPVPVNTHVLIGHKKEQPKWY